jgi:DNA modification methylase
VKHPAKYSDALLPYFAQHLSPGDRILDPFAGVGGIFRLQTLVPDLEIAALEIEPEWAAFNPSIVVGDALNLCALFPANYYNVVITSPAYGNRNADEYDGRDGSERSTYRAMLGRPLSAGSSGSLQWGPKYRAFHEEVWEQIYNILPYSGLFILNSKDHIRDWTVQRVTDWHIATLESLGFNLEIEDRVETPGNRYGANSYLRLDFEYVLAFRK